MNNFSRIFLFIMVFAESQLLGAHTPALLERLDRNWVAVTESGATSKRVGALSREEVLAPMPAGEEHCDELKPVASLEIEQPHSLLVTVHRGDFCGYLIRFWRRSRLGYILIHSAEKQDDPSPAFNSLELIHMRGEPLFHLKMVVPGTGALEENNFFWITPDGSIRDVTYIRPTDAYRGLKKDEAARDSERSVFTDQLAIFEFSIWRTEDAHCCPCAGQVSGRYKLRGSRYYNTRKKRWSADFAIVPIDFKRKPVDKADADRFCGALSSSGDKFFDTGLVTDSWSARFVCSVGGRAVPDRRS